MLLKHKIITKFQSDKKIDSPTKIEIFDFPFF